VAALVVQDKALQRVLAVWPMVRREELPGAVTGDFSLADCWGAVRFDEREAVDLSGLPLGLGIAALRRAKGLGLIYPDGSVHGLSSAVLRNVIREALPASGGKLK
jgi:hypothetical protein